MNNETNNNQISVINPYEEDDDEIDLTELFFQLLMHWKLILLFTILFGAVAFAYCRFFVTPQYASTSGLYVFSKSTSVTSLADLQIGSNLTTDYETVIASRPVLDRVIARLELEESYAELKEKIEISNPSDSRIIYITVTDPDPERAKEIADRTASIASTFISQKMDQDPPSIIQAGYTDGKPVSPRTRRNTAIAALVGFLLASAWIVIRYLLNDTINTPEDVRDKLGLEVLASLPLEDMSGTRKKKNKKNKKRRKSA